MAEIKLHFQLPRNLKAEDFIAKLGKKTAVQIAFQQHSLKKFYDSFDWRLYCADLLCELNQTKSVSQLRLLHLQSGEIIATADLDEVPAFTYQFEDQNIRNQLAPLLEMRALLPLATLNYQAYRLNILNKQQKTTVRLFIEDYESLPGRVYIQPIKGYDGAAKRISQLLEQKFNLKIVKKTLLQSALKVQGRKPKDYSSKLNIHLDPAMRADIACKYIYSSLLRTMQVNEVGTIDAIDSEFLHDFRVAVRRTRSGLSQLKHILPIEITAEYKRFFAWLGQITGLARDLDVYMLNFPEYKSSLPADMQNSLDPLYDFIQSKQIRAYQELAAKLKSSEYLSGLQAWEDYLTASVAIKPVEHDALQPIKHVADKRILKVYQQVLDQGNAIGDQSPVEALHELRKTCKKLRYLMEFFQSLYPEKDIAGLIKVLKSFQNILGDFQDYEVQEHTLKRFAEEMATQQTSAETFIAMGVLVQNLQQKREQARQHFAGSFAQFKQAENEAVFKALFAERVR